MYWQRRGKRVYVYVSEGGKPRALPRDQTRHLDHEPDHNVEAWVRQQEAAAGVPRAVAAVPEVWARRVDDYVAEMRVRRKSHKTQLDHRNALVHYIIPYFIGVHGLDDPNEWPAVSARMVRWLRGEGREEGRVPETKIEKINTALRFFWDWMGAERLYLNDMALRVRAALPREEVTPLQKLLTPAEALSWVRAAESRELKLAALLGYFFSLRPQELLALRRRDFRAGPTQCAELDACRIMREMGLYDRLAVEVTRQRLQGADKFGPPKAHSVGWVACFDQEAARQIVELLLQVEDRDKLLFGEHQIDWWFGEWDERGLRHGGVAYTLKDLRRASIYWLGHHSRLGERPINLKNHARHKKLDTTMLYCRRPGERADAGAELDLDA